MREHSFNRTLIITNPSSQSGKAEQAGQEINELLAAHPAWTTQIQNETTKCEGDGTRFASAAQGFDTILAIGGDGLVHDIMLGLMKLPQQKRPALGVIPMGSGNDYARTLGLSISKPQKALKQLVQGTVKCLDIGSANGVYFVQTVSFGLDAAIALNTIELRKQTNKTGMALYLESAIKVFSKPQEGYSFTAQVDDKEPFSGTEVVFACQVGPTYGGGFNIAPAASPTDDRLNLCYSKIAPPKVQALALLAKARIGKHLNSPILGFDSFKKLHVEFEEEPPGQVDGEPFKGRVIDVECVPAVLPVIVPHNK